MSVTALAHEAAVQIPPAAGDRPSPFEETAGWDLSQLLPDTRPEAIERYLAEVEASVGAFEARRPELSPDMDPAVLLDILRQYEALMERMDVIDAYGNLWFASNTQSSAALSFRSNVDQLLTRLDNRILFFGLWWRNLDDEQAERLLPAEADYRHYLQDRRRWKRHTLDETAEKVINLKDANGIAGIVTLYSVLTNRLEFRIEENGEVRTVNRAQLMSHSYSTDPDVRAAAYQELYRVYSAEATVLGQIYSYRVRDWANEQMELRGFDSPIAVRHLRNDIPAAAVDTLLQVVREERGIFQRYFRLKAQWLGMDRLRRYDIYAPLAPSRRNVPFGEAVRTVLDTFHHFHPTLGQLAERVFLDRHIDSEIRKGKRSGAFCSSVLPRLTPWVLINYTGRVRDTAELAHELGHAVHGMLAQDHSVLTHHASLPLCETASVFGEMLVTDRLLAAESDPLTRRELLAEAVSEIYATVTRQTYFVLFEKAAHQGILNGMSVPELNALYLENLREQFGDSVDVPDEFQHEWMAIPHIFSSPFYCYAYAFGQLLVLALYRRYQEEGEAFKPKLLKMLAYGGSARPGHILDEAGIDPSDPDFWRGGLQVIAGMIDELEGLGAPQA